jgi:hypothetical protein
MQEFVAYNKSMIELMNQRNNLIAERMKLDKFFSMYLEKFERKMDPSNPNTPVWQLYKKKHTEYGTLCQEIRNIEYWIAKQNV